MTSGRFSKWKVPLIIFAITLALAVILIATKPEAPTRPSAEKSWQVSAVKAKRTSAHPEIELYAQAESPHQARLSATIAADVAKLNALAGDRVKRGDVLLALDNTEALLQLMQAEADVSDLEAKIESEHTRFKTDKRSLQSEKRMLEIAQQALERQSKLQASKLVAQERAETAESGAAQAELKIAAREQSIADHPSRLKQLQASLKRAKAKLQLAQRDVEKTKITAPFDAQVISVNVSPGDRVQPGQALVEVYDNKQIELRAQIPNNVVAEVEGAMMAKEQITAHSGKRKFELKRLAGASSISHGGRDGWFQPSEESAPVALRENLKIFMLLPLREGLIALPLSAIYGTDRVFKVVDERLVSAKVEIAGYQYLEDTRDKVLVTSPDIVAGDIVITTQLPKAINGLKVSVQE